MSAVGGGASAERMRKGEQDLYEERVDDMHTNIGKFSFSLPFWRLIYSIFLILIYSALLAPWKF